MNHLFIAWILLSPVVLILGSVLFHDTEKGKAGIPISVLTSCVIILLPFWAIYFLIK